jgi:multiple antibiotic resistance protein
MSKANPVPWDSKLAGAFYYAGWRMAHLDSVIRCLLRWQPLSLSEYILLAASSLFVIVDPLAAVPAFIAMTPHDTPEQRSRMARLACCVMAGVLLVFALAGKLIFRLLGITMPAFQLAASVVLLLVALDMLRAKRSRVQETDEETAAGAEKTDIAITPLGIPMLAGPGAISTAILLENQARNLAQQAALCGCILAVAFVSYLILRLSAHGARWFGPIAMSIAIRIMGLLLAAVAMQFALNAIKGLRAELLGPLTN